MLEVESQTSSMLGQLNIHCTKLLVRGKGVKVCVQHTCNYSNFAVNSFNLEKYIGCISFDNTMSSVLFSELTTQLETNDLIALKFNSSQNQIQNKQFYSIRRQ